MENELQLKLEQLSEVMASDIKDKIQKDLKIEINPVYVIIKLIVILGFISFLLVITFMYYIYLNNQTCVQSPIQNIIVNERIIYKDYEIKNHRYHFKTEIHGEKLCKYYKNIEFEKSVFFTECKRIY